MISTKACSLSPRIEPSIRHPSFSPFCGRCPLYPLDVPLIFQRWSAGENEYSRFIHRRDAFIESTSDPSAPPCARTRSNKKSFTRTPENSYSPRMKIQFADRSILGPFDLLFLRPFYLDRAQKIAKIPPRRDRLSLIGISRRITRVIFPTDIMPINKRACFRAGLPRNADRERICPAWIHAEGIPEGLIDPDRP